MNKQDYTREEIAENMRVLREVFDVVRLVDPGHTRVCRVRDDGALEETPFYCHSVWNREERCSNCVSLQVMAEHRRMTKFEFMDEEIFYVVSRYITVEGQPCAMELVSNVTNEILLDARGKDALVQAVEHHNRKLYRDALTGAYNRTYYEEQLHAVSGAVGVAMVDVDNFKTVNDTYGHDAGDEVLRSVAGVLMGCVRSTDVVVRYGGDEFFLMVRDITGEPLRQKLEEVPPSVAALRFPRRPELRVSVSVGGVWFREAHSLEACMKDADVMLYEAKQRKNCLRFRCVE